VQAVLVLEATGGGELPVRDVHARHAGARPCEPCRDVPGAAAELDRIAAGEALDSTGAEQPGFGLRHLPDPPGRGVVRGPVAFGGRDVVRGPFVPLGAIASCVCGEVHAGDRNRTC